MSPTCVTVLRDLFLPRACVACATPGDWWCRECDREVGGAAPVLARVSDVWMCAAACYQGAARALILGLKEQRLTALARPAGVLLASAIRRHPDAARATAIVPVPGTSRGWRSRGFDVMELVLGMAPTLPVIPCLAWDRKRRAQKSLLRSERATNLVDAMTAQAAPQRVLVVDDIVTTGATVTESIRAIRKAGGSVVGVASIAYTPPVGGPIGRVRSQTR